MADPQVRIDPDADETGDVEMQGGDDDVVEVGDPGAAAPGDGGATQEPEAAAEEETKPTRVTFVE